MKKVILASLFSCIVLTVDAAVVSLGSDETWSGPTASDSQASTEDFFGPIARVEPNGTLKIAHGSEEVTMRTPKFENYDGGATLYYSSLSTESGGTIGALGLDVGDFILQDSTGADLYPDVADHTLEMIAPSFEGDSYGTRFEANFVISFGTISYQFGDSFDLELWVDGALVDAENVFAVSGDAELMLQSPMLDSSVAHAAQVRMKKSRTAFTAEAEWFIVQGELEALQDQQPAAVPEPSSLILIVLGGIGLMRRRRDA